MIGDTIDKKERLGVVDHNTKKLKTSGYNHNQCKELIRSGVMGYNNKIKKNGQPFYRCAKSTLGGRIKKKWTERNRWYKKRGSEGQMGNFKGLNANGKPDKKTSSKQELIREEGGLHATGGVHAIGGLHATGEKRKRADSNREEMEEGLSGGMNTSKSPAPRTGTASQSPQRRTKEGRVEMRNVKKEIQVKTVIFIPQTANSQLAKMLREEEKILEKMTG